MKWTKLYTDILREPLLTAYAKTVYAAIKSYADKSGKCWPSKALIALDTGFDERTITTAIYELWFFGVLTWNSGHDGKANTYFFNDETAASRILHHKAPKVSFKTAFDANKKAANLHEKTGGDTPLDLPYPTLRDLPTKKNHRRASRFITSSEQPQNSASQASA
jgi:hypothetical protein